MKRKKQDLKHKRDDLISRQFCDFLRFISSSLSTGKNIEGALRDSAKELEFLYGSDDEIIVKEVKMMLNKMSVNRSIVEALNDFAKRSGNVDIYNFSEAIKLCRYTGGNLVEVVRNTHYIMSLKLETKNDIDVIVTQQKLNLKFLIIFPFILLGIISLTANDYILPLYSGYGRVINILVLLLIILAQIIGRSIMRIRL